MAHTLRFENGTLRMASLQFGDFAATLSIVQSFALGHNFPPQYPHFAGPPMSYHFMFHFLAGNLEWLGLRLHTAVNALSILSVIALLLLTMTLGERLFDSRAVGRIAASLFFFHSSLGYTKFLMKEGTIAQAAQDALKLRDPVFLDSIFPYRGEGWGLWTLNVFLNQRHLAGPMAVLVLVLLFLADAYDWRLRGTVPAPEPVLLPILDAASEEAAPAAARVFEEMS
jgi:hypothetical protein